MGAALTFSVADRIRLIRSTFSSFPAVAVGSRREPFEQAVAAYGAEAVFGYLWKRRIVNTALPVHSWHAAVQDEAGPFWLFRQAGLAVRELHRIELARIAEAFGACDVPLMVYKGLSLDLLLGNTDAPSFSNDIDVLIHQASLPEARNILESIGYESGLRIDRGKVRRLPPRITRMTDDSIYSFGQVQPYDRLVAMPELDALGERLQALLPTFFCRVDGVLHFKLSIDVHYTLNLLTEDIGTRVKPPESTWWDGAQSVEVDGKSITTLSDETLSWVLLHRLYVDCVLLNDLSIKGLGHVKLLHKYGRLDVQHVLETAHRYPYIGPSILYALRAANLICGLGIKDTIDMPAIRATKAPLMNAGDCLPAFLDFGLSVELNEAKPLEGEIVIQTF